MPKEKTQSQKDRLKYYPEEYPDLDSSCGPITEFDDDELEDEEEADIASYEEIERNNNRLGICNICGRTSFFCECFCQE